MKKMKRREFIKLGLSAVTIGAIGPIFIKDAFASRVTIKIGHLPITDHLTIISHARNKFDNANIKPVKFSNWSELSEAIKGGSIEAAFALTPIGLSLRQKGIPIKAVLLGHRNGSVITVKIGDRINKFEDLKGKKIAIPSKLSTHHILIRKILADRGISAEQVNLIEIAPPKMVDALANNQIDGFIVAEPYGAQAEFQKVGKVLILSRDIWKDHICCVLNVREEIIKNSPDAVQELVDNIVDTGKFIKQNPREAARLAADYIGQKPDIIEFIVTTPKDRITFDNLYPTAGDFKATQDYMLKFGIAEKQVDLNQYIDDRFAKKIYRV